MGEVIVFPRYEGLRSGNQLGACDLWARDRLPRELIPMRTDRIWNFVGSMATDEVPGALALLRLWERAGWIEESEAEVWRRYLAAMMAFRSANEDIYH